MSKIILPLFYFPPVSYFSIWSEGKILIEGNESFQKQTFRNRCHIPGPNKIERLTVPVVGSRKNIPIQDIKIDESVDWRKIHWRTIQASYGNAPFFDHYGPKVQALINHKSDTLWGLNIHILTNCLKLLRLDGFQITRSFEKEYKNDDLDLRTAFDAKINGQLPSFFKPANYYQIFGTSFAPNMSIIDLIFCEGPASKQIIESSLSDLNK